MKILIIGGTVFLGKTLVEWTSHEGHDVWIFHRGNHPANFPFPVHEILGDRDGSLAELENLEWDIVMDTSGYVPRVVRKSADFLKNKAKRYVFISSISVYKDPIKPELAEESPLDLHTVETEEITGDTYGSLKAHCELAVQEIWSDRSLIIRPGLIVGPHDPTDRFTYWLTRILRGGEVASPGNPFQQVQFIDVRDLAQWILHLSVAGMNGVFNVTGPANSLSMAEYLNTCRAVLDKPVEFTWLSEEFLMQQNVRPFVEMPLWVPAESKGFNQIDIHRALEQGLQFRSLEETIRDTINWYQNQYPADRAMRAGLSRLREEDLLSSWKNLGQY